MEYFIILLIHPRLRNSPAATLAVGLLLEDISIGCADWRAAARVAVPPSALDGTLFPTACKCIPEYPEPMFVCMAQPSTLGLQKIRSSRRPISPCLLRWNSCHHFVDVYISLRRSLGRYLLPRLTISSYNSRRV